MIFSVDTQRLKQLIISSGTISPVSVLRHLVLLNPGPLLGHTMNQVMDRVGASLGFSANDDKS